MDSHDYQRSTLPSRLPTPRGTSVPAPRYANMGPGEASNPSPLSARAVLRASRRYWWLILALWTVGISGLGALIYLKVRPQFRAMSLLKVEPNMLELYGSSSPIGGVSYMQTYVELIRSPTVFLAAIHEKPVEQLGRSKFTADPVQELTKAIQVVILPNTHLIEVSMISNSPDEAAIIVNAVVTAFLRANKSWSGQSAQDQIKKLQAYHTDLKAKGSLLEDEIKVLAARGAKIREVQVVVKDKGSEGKDSPPATTNWNVEHYQRVVNQCLQTKTELAMAEAHLIDVQRAADESERLAAAGGPKDQMNLGVELRLKNDPQIRDLNVKHLEAWNKFNTAKKKAVNGMNDPGVRLLATKARDAEAAVRKAQEVARERIQEEMQLAGPNVLTPTMELQRVRSEIQQLGSRRNALEAQIANLKVETNKQMTEEVEVRFKEDQRKFIESNANFIQNKLDALTIEQMNEERIHQLDPARRENLPISDKRKMYLAAMPIGVLGLVLTLAILLEVRSGRVADPEFLSTRMAHEVFAIAPLPTARAALGVASDRNEQRLARFVQSLDHLRVALCEGGTNGEGRCVMITSATGGEGKTTLSAHLAARCANAGTATLLIDADLRRGSLGRLLDVPAGPGLGDLLAGNVELDGGLISTQAGGFHFLSVGSPGIDPTRVLRSTRLAELIGQFRQMYDLIIIDTPPVLPVADALILGRWADGAVMAARYDASRLPLLERANRQITAAGIPVLGVVVNGVRGQEQAYGSYAYNYAYPGHSDSIDGGVTAL